MDPPTGAQINEQVAAEQAYHIGDGIVPLLPGVKNPALIITASDDLINPPSNQAYLLTPYRDGPNLAKSLTGALQIHKQQSDAMMLAKC